MSIRFKEKGQTEAGLALGYTPRQSFLKIVLPQVVKSVMPVYQGEIISLLKGTSIVGYIAVADMTHSEQSRCHRPGFHGREVGIDAPERGATQLSFCRLRSGGGRAHRPRFPSKTSHMKTSNLRTSPAIPGHKKDLSWITKNYKELLTPFI